MQLLGSREGQGEPPPYDPSIAPKSQYRQGNPRGGYDRSAQAAADAYGMDPDDLPFE